MKSDRGELPDRKQPAECRIRQLERQIITIKKRLQNLIIITKPHLPEKQQVLFSLVVENIIDNIKDTNALDA